MLQLLRKDYAFIVYSQTLIYSWINWVVMVGTKIPKLQNGSKGGFEPKVSRLRVRHSTAEPVTAIDVGQSCIAVAAFTSVLCSLELTVDIFCVIRTSISLLLSTVALFFTFYAESVCWACPTLYHYLCFYRNIVTSYFEHVCMFFVCSTRGKSYGDFTVPEGLEYR